MTDPLRAAIFAELERQAAEGGDWCQPDGDGVFYDGHIDLEELCAAIRRSLATPFEHQAPTTGETGKA